MEQSEQNSQTQEARAIGSRSGSPLRL